VSSPAAQRLAILVHEVRSPAAALAAIADTYGDERLEHDARRSLVDLALAACRGIERIVTDATVASVSLEPLDVGRVVVQTVDSASLRGAFVRADVQPGLPRIEGDALRLRQALDNLVANAVTHAGVAAEIVVQAHVREGELLLAVSDAGRGIPRDQQERIFEAGVRLDRTRPGSGLGLAITRAIADAHGATLRLDSAPERGATFTLAFPLG
jgi:signal transduction histidine kinase